MNLKKEKTQTEKTQTEIAQTERAELPVEIKGGKKARKAAAKAEKANKAAEAKKNKLAKKKQKQKKETFTKQTFMLVSVGAILVMAVAYVFVYLDYTQKTEELENENMTLRKELDELEVYYNNMNKYKQDIEEYRTAISDIMAEYPAGAKEEDILMLAVQLQQNNDIAYSVINMEEPEVVYSIPQEQIAPAGIEGFDSMLSFMQKHATYVNVTNYDNLKSCIEDVYASKNRIGIDNIIYTKNEEDGTLDGSISLYFYSAIGTGKEYEPPDIAAYISGTDDLFKSNKVVVQDETVEGEDEGGEEEAGEED